jgi:hypothetical protein
MFKPDRRWPLTQLGAIWIAYSQRQADGVARGNFFAAARLPSS